MERKKEGAGSLLHDHYFYFFLISWETDSRGRSCSSEHCHCLAGVIGPLEGAAESSNLLLKDQNHRKKVALLPSIFKLCEMYSGRNLSTGIPEL